MSSKSRWVRRYLDLAVAEAKLTLSHSFLPFPPDLATMESKLEANTYNTLAEFIYDAKLIFSNCRAYNDLGSNCTSFGVRSLRLLELIPRPPLQTSRTPTNSSTTWRSRSRCTRMISWLSL